MLYTNETAAVNEMSTLHVCTEQYCITQALGSMYQVQKGSRDIFGLKFSL